MTALRLPVEAKRVPWGGTCYWIVRDPSGVAATDCDLLEAFEMLAARQDGFGDEPLPGWSAIIAQEKARWEGLYVASDFEHAATCNGNPHLPRGTAGCSCLFRERATFKDSLIAGDAWNAAALIENAAMNARPAPSEHAR